MKSMLILLSAFSFQLSAFSDNVFVTNSSARPVPVTLTSGSISSALGTGTTVSSSAYEASHVLKNSAGTLISVAGYNSKVTAQWIQVYNSTTVPSDGAVPIITFTVPGQANFSFDVPVTGFRFTTGISVSNSSTGPTKTIGSADVFYFAQIL